MRESSKSFRLVSAATWLRGSFALTARIAYPLKSPSDRPLRVVAGETFAEYLRQRLSVRVIDDEDLLSPGLDLAACVAEALNRFDESTAISDLLELHELDGIAYVLEGLADAIVYRERQERLRRLTPAGRPPKPRAMLTSCLWALMELDPTKRLRLLSRLIADFLDERPSAESLRNQINRAEARSAEKRRQEGLPEWKMTAAFRSPSYRQ